MHDPLDFDATLQKFAAGNTVFDRYLLKRLIGKGRHGDVWEAEDRRLAQPVALKLLINYPHYERLAQGIGKSITLTHPNIVRTFDLVGDKSVCAVVMELMSGPSLAQSLREKEPPFFEAAEVMPWARDLFAALDHAWRTARLVHGDVRAARLFLTKSGSLKVGGYAFAAVRGDRPLISKDGADDGAVFLPGLSPQVVAGEPTLHSDDVYSAGAALYELLTGKPVFPGGNVVVQIQRKVPPSITERRTEMNRKGAAVPKAFEQLTARCLAKEREERPSTAAEVVTSLEATSTKTSKTKSGTSRALGRERGTTGWLAHPLVVLVIVVLLAGGAVYGLVLKPGRDEIARRRTEYDALAAADTTAKTDAESRIKDWQAFIDRCFLKDVPFNDEDERITELSETRLAALKKSWEDERTAQRTLARQIAEKTDGLRDAIRVEKKIVLPADATAAALGERIAAWTKLIATHDTKDRPQTEDFKSLVAEATREQSGLQARLDAAKNIEKQKHDADEAMRLIEASWRQGVSIRMEKLRALCADAAATPADKVTAIHAFIEHVGDKPPESTKADAAKSRSEAEALLKDWTARMVAVTPKSPLDLKQLLAHSPYSEESLKATVLKDEAEKDAARFVIAIQKKVLTQAQEKIFSDAGLEFENKAKAKADGSPGRTTHSAILAYQAVPAKKLIPNAELDSATLNALGLDKLDVAALVESEKKASEEEKMKVVAEADDRGTAAKSSGSSGKTSTKAKGNSRWKTHPPEKSIYDKPMGKSREVLDRARGGINAAEWQKHLIWLQYCEWLGNQ